MSKTKEEKEFMGKHYVISGEGKAKITPTYPRCGADVFLAKHPWGYSCGKCGDRYGLNSFARAAERKR